MAEREILTQERVQQIVDGSKVDPNGYEFAQLARLALKSFTYQPVPTDEARALIEKMKKALIPFSAAIFDDNGGVTISTGHIVSHDYRAARDVDTAADAWLKANGG